MIARRLVLVLFRFGDRFLYGGHVSLRQEKIKDLLVIEASGQSCSPPWVSIDLPNLLAVGAGGSDHHLNLLIDLGGQNGNFLFFSDGIQNKVGPHIGKYLISGGLDTLSNTRFVDVLCATASGRFGS